MVLMKMVLEVVIEVVYMEVNEEADMVVKIKR